MEDLKSSQAHKKVLAPRDYFLGPVFAATKQTGAREITIGDRRYQIGGFHPLRRNLHPPALDVRHARAVFALLSFREPYGDDDSRLIRFSINDLCRRYARSNGGRYSRDVAHILADLLDSYIRVTDVKTGVSHEYRLIEEIDIERRPIRRRDAKLAADGQTEMWFNGCRLSPEFFKLLGRITELQDLDLDVFTSIRSPLAQAIYLYIPSRAHHHSSEQPFEISLSKLLEQVSFRIPPQKQRRLQIVTQHADQGRSIMQQLEGLATLTGVFKVRLAETNDGADWKLQAWVEHRERKMKLEESDSKLIQAYLKSGRPPELLQQALAKLQAIDGYEEELMAAANVVVSKNRRFFELAKALLGSRRFVELLGDAKSDELEGRKATKNPTARLIHRIMQAVEAPIPTAPSKSPMRTKLLN